MSPIFVAKDSSLAVSVADFTGGDDVINTAERTAGFELSGDLGLAGAGAMVQIDFDGVSVTTVAASDQMATAGEWSYTVPTADIPTGTTPLTIDVSVSVAGTTTTGSETVTVDTEAPTATYTIPALTAGVSVGMIDPTEPSDVSTRAISGLPTGLTFDPANGRISGTPPRFSATAATATVTLTDDAGNAGESEIVFAAPAVARQTQVLSGFSYTPARVTFPGGSTATPPSTRTTPLSYATTDTGVCTVNSGSGAVTAVGAGTCRVTVMAPPSNVYAQATATASVEVERDLVGSNVLVVSSRSDTDAYINRLEYAAGLTVSGMFARENGATVSLTFDGARAEETTTAANGAWSVEVTTGTAYTYIGTISEGDPLTLQAVASKTGFAAATVDVTVTVDLEDPSVRYAATPDLREGRGVTHNVADRDSAGSFSIDPSTPLPAGLSINTGTGVISGTVRAPGQSAPITVTVRYEDAAGNAGTTQIVYNGITSMFVDLGGISYSASTFPTAPTLLGGNTVNDEMYSSETPEICTVNDAATGALTAVDQGTCMIEITHPGTADLVATTVTVDAVINAAGAVTVSGPVAAVKPQDVEAGVSVTVSLSGGSVEVLTVSFNGAHPATVTLASARATVAVPEAALVGSALRVSVSGPAGFDYSDMPMFALQLGLAPEELATVSEAVLSEVGGIAAIQAVDVIGSRLGAPGANSASQGFSLQVDAARLESARQDQERAGQMSGWAELASQKDFDRAMLGRSSFSLSSGGEGAAWTLWGKGAYREYERDEGGVETDGDVLSGFVGLDFDRGRLRHGLAVGRTWGDGSFSVGADASNKGKYELDLTSGYYYLRGRTDFGSLWGLLGAGTGEMRIVNGDQRSEPDLTMQMAAAGAEVDLRKGPSVDLTARAEGMVTRLESEDALVVGADRVLAGGEYGSQRLRVAIEASKEMELEGGAQVRPSADAGVRYDGGDGVEGAGIELGGGLEFSSGSLTTELHATWLAAHREDLEEWGASVSARYGLGRVVQHGLWLGAEAAGGLERGVLGLDTQAGDAGAWLRDSEETDGDATGGLFSAEVGYGIGMRRLGLVTPFVGFSSDSSSRWTFSQGLRLRLNGGRVDAELAGTQSHGGGDDDDYSYGIEIKAHF